MDAVFFAILFKMLYFSRKILYNKIYGMPKVVFPIMRKDVMFVEIQNKSLNLFSNDWTNSERILWTPSSTTKKALLYVQEIGTLTVKKAHESPRSALDSYLFVMVLEGNGTFTVKNKSYHLHEENIIFLNCNNAYSHCSSSDNPWKIAWIHFNGCTAAALYELFEQRNPSIVISASLEPYKILFEQIKNTLKNEELNCELYASQYLSQLTTMLITASQEEHQRNARESIEKWEKIRFYLEKHFAEKITLEDLSQRFSISKYYMLREFKKQYGVTIMQYLNQCRMNHAKKLLRFTELSVEKIAESCGIPDASYFNRTFRASEGLSAGSFRNQWKN